LAGSVASTISTVKPTTARPGCRARELVLGDGAADHGRRLHPRGRVLELGGVHVALGVRQSARNVQHAAELARVHHLEPLGDEQLGDERARHPLARVGVAGQIGERQHRDPLVVREVGLTVHEQSGTGGATRHQQRAQGDRCRADDPASMIISRDSR